jgi:phosphatidylinositol alpha-mannosyltransferase
MRILHLDPDDIDNPLSGGGPLRNYEIYRRLAKRHEITVLTPTFTGSTSEIIRDGVRYIRLGRKIRNHGSSHHITFFFSLPKAVRSFDYDLLIEDFMPPASATLNPLFARAPVIASVQWFFAEALSRQYRLPFYLGERYGVKLYRNFIVLTASMEQTIAARQPKAFISKIPNGIDRQLLETRGSFGDYILFIGRVDIEQKGVDLLLQAYSLIPNSKRLPLILAGHSFQQEKIAGIISRLGLEGHVSLAGKVSGLQKLELIANCRFCCIPSREETFGMVITEACASGKTVVLFDKAPMNEAASPECIKVPPYDVEAYAQAMLTLIEEPQANLAQRAEVHRKWAAQFDWDNIALQQESFYHQVQQNNRSGLNQK